MSTDETSKGQLMLVTLVSGETLLAYRDEPEQPGGTQFWVRSWQPVTIIPDSGRRSVLQDWVQQLTMMQQSVLLTAVRGPDGLPKYHPVKYLLRWYRRCILLSSFQHRVYRAAETHWQRCRAAAGIGRYPVLPHPGGTPRGGGSMTQPYDLVDDLDFWEVEDPDNALVLVACSSAKLDRPAPARELYTGALFAASVRWAESWSFRWLVLSAGHGLVEPDAFMQPYDYRLPRSGELEPRLISLLRCQQPDDVTSVIVLGGQRYVDAARLAFPRLAWWAPLQELPARGYGHYRSWLNRNTRREAS